MLRGPVGVDIARTDALHAELLHRRRYGLRTEGGDPDAAHIVDGHVLDAGGIGHDRLEEGGARLEQGDPVALDNGGETPGMREQRRALGNDRGHAQRQRRGDQIGLSGNPARIADHVQAVVYACIEHHAHAVGDARQPAAVGMHDALGLAGRARGIDDKQWPVRRHRLGGMAGIQRAPVLSIAERFQLVQAARLEARVDGCCEYPVTCCRHQIVGPAVPRLHDDFLTRVAHNDDPLDGVLDARQFPGDGGAQFRGALCGQRLLGGECGAQFAHEVAAFEGDFTGHTLTDSGNDARLRVTEVVVGNHRLEAVEGGAAGNEVVQRRVRKGFLVGHDLGIAVATIRRDHHLRARVEDAIGQCFCRKTAENRRIDNAQALGGLGVVDLLENIRQVECDAVAAHQAQPREHLGPNHRFQQQTTVADVLLVDRPALAIIA